MRDDTPLVSICIPVYNGSTFILDTLESVQKQDYPNMELIILDDGSTDDSYNLCEAWVATAFINVSLHRNEINRGVTTGCNILLSLAKGKYFQLLGQDDILLPAKISTDVQILEQSPGTAFVYSPVKLINEKGEFTGEDYAERIGDDGKPKQNMFEALVKQNFIAAPSVLMRTAFVKAVGGYDEDLLFEDWDMWLKLSKNYKVVFNEHANVLYRIHAGSVMADRDKEKNIKRNDSSIRMFHKFLGHKNKYDEVVLLKLKELIIYSFFIGDKTAMEKMREFLALRKDFKIMLYYMFANLGLKHPSNIIKKTIK